MKKKFNTLCRTGAIAFALCGATSAYALPELQLTIVGGNYNGTTETTLAGGSLFNLYALFTPKKISPTDTFYIAAALEKGPGDGSVNDLGPLSNSAISGGSFVFGGSTVNVSGDMAYGTPNGLPTHGEYSTFFKEFSFIFSGQKTSAFNTETTTPTSDLLAGCTVGCAYFESFAVDMTNLDPTYSIHFDLYHKNADGVVSVFAPFSHDAQSGNGGCDGDCDGHVPEPSTSALFGLALVALAAVRRMRLTM